eukprot:GHVP01047553.1.p1 GENE.GHVP01047553.1~~GHVP01047553.1.p1  ORF type:complete len:678 (+),score=114.19 GHVP01047553.1:64-2097(+)
MEQSHLPEFIKNLKGVFYEIISGVVHSVPHSHKHELSRADLKKIAQTYKEIGDSVASELKSLKSNSEILKFCILHLRAFKGVSDHLKETINGDDWDEAQLYIEVHLSRVSEAINAQVMKSIWQLMETDRKPLMNLQDEELDLLSSLGLSRSPKNLELFSTTQEYYEKNAKFLWEKEEARSFPEFANRIFEAEEKFYERFLCKVQSEPLIWRHRIAVRNALLGKRYFRWFPSFKQKDIEKELQEILLSVESFTDHMVKFDQKVLSGNFEHLFEHFGKIINAYALEVLRLLGDIDTLESGELSSIPSIESLYGEISSSTPSVDSDYSTDTENRRRYQRRSRRRDRSYSSSSSRDSRARPVYRSRQDSRERKGSTPRRKDDLTPRKGDYARRRDDYLPPRSNDYSQPRSNDYSPPRSNDYSQPRSNDYSPRPRRNRYDDFSPPRRDDSLPRRRDEEPVLPTRKVEMKTLNVPKRRVYTTPKPIYDDKRPISISSDTSQYSTKKLNRPVQPRPFKNEDQSQRNDGGRSLNPNLDSTKNSANFVPPKVKGKAADILPAWMQKPIEEGDLASKMEKAAEKQRKKVEEENAKKEREREKEIMNATRYKTQRIDTFNVTGANTLPVNQAARMRNLQKAQQKTSTVQNSFITPEQLSSGLGGFPPNPPYGGMPGGGYVGRPRHKRF